MGTKRLSPVANRVIAMSNSIYANLLDAEITYAIIFAFTSSLTWGESFGPFRGVMPVPVLSFPITRGIQLLRLSSGCHMIFYAYA